MSHESPSQDAFAALRPIAARLVELCQQGENIAAIKELYSEDIVSEEAVEMPGHPRELKGKEAVIGKTQWWLDNHEIHGADMKGPFFFAPDTFSLWMWLDVTAKHMNNTRMVMEEVCVYTVKDGKIVHEAFHYDMPV